VKALKPVNRFRKEGDAWVWNFENLEPSLADELVVKVEPTVESMHGGGRLCHGRNEMKKSQRRWPWVSLAGMAFQAVQCVDGKWEGTP
jgi:hypothetical protein